MTSVIYIWKSDTCVQNSPFWGAAPKPINSVSNRFQHIWWSHRQYPTCEITYCSVEGFLFRMCPKIACSHAGKRSRSCNTMLSAAALAHDINLTLPRRSFANSSTDQTNVPICLRYISNDAIWSKEGPSVDHIFTNISFSNSYKSLFFALCGSADDRYCLSDSKCMVWVTTVSHR